MELIITNDGTKKYMEFSPTWVGFVKLITFSGYYNINGRLFKLYIDKNHKKYYL